MIKNGLRIFYDDFSKKVKNIHDEMEKHHSNKKKACITFLKRNLTALPKTKFVEAEKNIDQLWHLQSRKKMIRHEYT